MKLSIIILALTLAGCASGPRPGETPEQAAQRRQEGIQLLLGGMGQMGRQQSLQAAPPVTQCRSARTAYGYTTICQ